MSIEIKTTIEEHKAGYRFKCSSCKRTCDWDVRVGHVYGIQANAKRAAADHLRKCTEKKRRSAKKTG